MAMVLVIILAACGGFVMGRMAARFLVPGKGIVRKVAPYLLFSLMIMHKSWIGDYNPLYLFPFFMLVFLFCYGGPWYARLVSGTVFFCLLEPLCMMVDSANFPHIETWEQELIPLLSKLAAWALLWLLSRRIVPQGSVPPLSGKLWALLGALTLAPLFSTLSFTIWTASDLGYDAYDLVAPRIAYTMLPFAVLSALALLVAIVVLSRHEMLEQQQKLFEVQQTYYQGLAREQTAVRTLRHDLHNHAAAAQGLIESGDIDGARQYLAGLSQSAALTGTKRYCENGAANALLASKAALMEREGIRCDIQVSLPEELPFPDVELCALLGNALDNAVEAAAQAADKWVSLHARTDKGMLMLQVKNAVSAAPKREKGRFITTKTDAVHHGYGVAGMQEIARRHGGMCEAAYTQEEFSLLASIPLVD